MVGQVGIEVLPELRVGCKRGRQAADCGRRRCESLLHRLLRSDQFLNAVVILGLFGFQRGDGLRLVLLRGLGLAVGCRQLLDAGIGLAVRSRNFLLDDVGDHRAQLVSNAHGERADDLTEGGRGHARGAARDRSGRGHSGGYGAWIRRSREAYRATEDAVPLPEPLHIVDVALLDKGEARGERAERGGAEQAGARGDERAGVAPGSAVKETPQDAGVVLPIHAQCSDDLAERGAGFEASEAGRGAGGGDFEAWGDLLVR